MKTYELNAVAEVKGGSEENGQDVTVSRFRRFLPQVIASLSCNFMLMVLSLSIAFPTLVIGTLLNAKGELTLDDDQASWLGSIAFICQPFGSVASGVVVEALGRKKSMLLLNVPYLAGFILLSVANSYTILVLANVLLGITIGLTEAPINSYIGEIAEPEIRGIMTASAGIFLYLGWLFEYLLGALTTWRKAVAISAAVPVFTSIFLALVPESPVWLISKDRAEDARKALCWLRGWTKPEAVDEELKDLVRYHSETKFQQRPKLDNGHVNPSFVADTLKISDSNTFPKININVTENKKSETEELSRYRQLVAIVRDMINPPTLRPLLLVVTFFFFVHWAGLTPIRPYMVHVFQEFQTPIAAEWAMVLTAAVSMVGAIALMLLVHRFGKRVLSLIGTGIMAILTLLLGLYAYLEIQQDKPSEIARYQWMPLVLFSSMSFINSAVGQVPWMLISEVFPFRTRGIAGGLSAACCYVFLFLASKTYLDIEKSFRLHGTFWFYGCISVVGFVFLYLRLLETEGRTLEEIEAHFTKGEYPRTVKKK